MKLVILVLSLISLSAFGQDHLEDTVDEQKYESLARNCKYEIMKLESDGNHDIAELYKTLLKIQSSKSCKPIKSFSPKELGRTRGGVPCSINPENELTGISFGTIAIQVDGESNSSIKWGTGHIEKMSVEKYLYKGTQYAEPMSKQLMESGLCKNLKTTPKTEVTSDIKDCSAYELSIKGIDSPGSKPSNYDSLSEDDKLAYDGAQVDLKFSYKDGKKNCEITIKEDDGIAAMSFMMLQAKQRHMDSKDKNVEFKPEEIKYFREALKRHSNYTAGAAYGEVAEYESYKKENAQLKEHLSALIEKNKANMTVEDFSKALDYMGQRVLKHGYSRDNSCNGSGYAFKDLSDLLYGGGGHKGNPWALEKLAANSGCPLKVIPLEFNSSTRGLKSSGSQIEN